MTTMLGTHMKLIGRQGASSKSILIFSIVVVGIIVVVIQQLHLASNFIDALEYGIIAYVFLMILYAIKLDNDKRKKEEKKDLGLGI